MKRLFSIWIFLFLITIAQGQLVRGRVLDAEKRSPVPVAVVYFDGTSTASYTNEEGDFTIEVKSHSGMPLTISALGYYTRILNDFSTNRPLTVYLEPKIFEFSDVTISARGDPNIRKQNLAIFRREFLGRTRNAKECEIMNENDIRFTSSRNKDTLRAYSLKPIFIMNKALGYRITYYLNKFEYVESAYTNQLIGNSIFDVDTSGTDPEMIRLRRDNSYYGSKMHFIRSLWTSELLPSEYSLKNGKKQVNPKDIVRKQLSMAPGRYKKVIFYPEVLPVTLKLIWSPGKAESGMELLRNNIGVEENGFYQGPGIIWHGEMAKQGIADLLPYDYQPFGKFNDNYFASFRINDTISAGLMMDVADLTEKVYLHTDRDIYSPGDDLWFKAYLVDGITHELTDTSGNLYVELISPESEIINRRILKLQKGLGNGDFYLPGDLPAGNYILRAYTNFMRNFSDEAFYHKCIRIIAGSEVQILKSTPASKDPETEQAGFRFFPEGGSLVENVQSIVAFKATDSNGLGCDVKGEIRSSSGMLITTFRSSHHGMGSFSFRPEEGIDYHALITNPDGSIIRKNLPAIFPSGFVINIQKNNLNETLVTLRINSKTYTDYKDRDVMVTLSSHGKILKVISYRINSMNTRFVLPAEELPNGIVMLTLYGNDNRPISERLVYIDNKPGTLLNIETDGQRYEKRDSVSIIFSIDGDHEPAFLSLSVSNDIFTEPVHSTISSWFLLESDIIGPVEDASSYFDSSNPARLADLDLLLLTQGWRDFEWKYSENRFFPEKGFKLSGRLRRSLLVSPVINQEIILAVFQDEKNVITSTRTDSSGRFRFEIENLSGRSQMVFSAINKRGNSIGILLLDTMQNFAPVKRLNSWSPLIKSKNETLETSDINANIGLVKTLKKKYSLSDTIMIDEVQITAMKKVSAQEIRINQSRDKYGTPDDEIVVTPNMRNAFNIKELLTGKVGGLMFVKPASTLESGIRIRGVSSLMMGQEPLFLLDGMTSSYATVSMIPTSFIDRIDVIKGERAAAYGMQGANGIISVITKTGPDLSETISLNSVSKAFEGFNEPRIFYSPLHNKAFESGYKPDLRSTLLWMPDIKINTNENYRVKFFNGDIPSTYRIIIEGLTSDGIPVTGQMEYELLDL